MYDITSVLYYLKRFHIKCEQKCLIVVNNMKWRQYLGLNFVYITTICNFSNKKECKKEDEIYRCHIIYF